VLFTLGSFLPIMITTQSLLTPRLSVLARSWVTGSVLSALAYGAYRQRLAAHRDHPHHPPRRGPGRRDHLQPTMTATLLAHAVPHGGTQGFTGVVLLLLGAAAALWWTRRRNG
jgi:hypothetical protein